MMNDMDVINFQSKASDIISALNNLLRISQTLGNEQKILDDQKKLFAEKNKEVEKKNHEIQDKERELQKREAEILAREKLTDTEKEKILVREKNLNSERETMAIDQARIRRDSAELASNKTDEEILKLRETNLEQGEKDYRAGLIQLRQQEEAIYEREKKLDLQTNDIARETARLQKIAEKLGNP